MGRHKKKENLNQYRGKKITRVNSYYINSALLEIPIFNFISYNAFIFNKANKMALAGEKTEKIYEFLIKSGIKLQFEE